MTAPAGLRDLEPLLPAARRITSPADPGTREWWSSVSASKVSSILRVNRPTWDSRFTLWHLMAGRVQPDPPNEEMARGHYLEAGVAAWGLDQEPAGTVILPGGVWRSRWYPWATAAPDRWLWHDEHGLTILECKTDDSDDDWEMGVPAYYRVQVLWQMIITGCRRAVIARLGSRLRFERYVIEWDPAEAAHIVQECLRFWRDLQDGTVPPLDDSESTYRTVRKLHPEIERGEAVQIPPDVAVLLQQRHAAVAAAKRDLQGSLTEVADLMGSAQYAYTVHSPDDAPRVARRKARGDSAPWVEVIQPKGSSS